MKYLKSMFGAFAFTLVLSAQVQAQTFLTNGLVAYYPLNDTGSETVSDASGNGNNGLIVGADWQYSPDRFGSPESSLFLNMTNPNNTNDGTYVAIPRGATLDFNQDFTLSVWVNIPDGLPPFHVHNLVSDGQDTTSANFRIISAVDNTNDYLQFVGGISGVSSGNYVDIHTFLAPKRSIWWQAVVVRSGTNLSLFQNGALVPSTVLAMNATLVNAAEIRLGLHVPSGYPLDGGIDDVRMYNRALTQQEVQQLYAYESGPIVTLVKAVKPTFSNLTLLANYQLQVSGDLVTWTNQGSAFTATNSSMAYPQYWDVDNWSQLFFRVQLAP